MMKKLTLALGAAALLVMAGCSGKKYFDPPNTLSASAAVSSHGGKALYQTRDGITFTDQSYVTKNGVGSIRLPAGQVYLSEDSARVYATDRAGKLFILNRSTGATVQTVEFQVPIVSVAAKNGILVYLLQDNTFGLYKLASSTKIMENKAPDAYAVDTRIATPMFVDNLAVVPTLDGKLIVMDMNAPDNAKVIYISSETSLNNIIHLSRIGNLLIAATPNRVMTIGSAEGEFDQGISEVVPYGGDIYVFTKNGEVIRLNSSLEEVSRTKFKFAHFSAAAIRNGKIYALDHKGPLVVMDTAFKNQRIYDVGETDDYAFVSGGRIYTDGTIINLDRL